MSTAGQAVGGIVGAVAGFFVGGPSGAMYGAQLGMMAGGIIDPVKVKQTGPRLDDLTVQTSTYGANIPRVYGTITTSGNIFWLENNKLKEVAKKKKSGGKGGSETTVKTFSYYATFAVGLCEGPIVGVRRIWVGAKLFYDAGSDDINSVVASNSAADLFTLHTGTDTQEPDERMQATLGIANTPAYRGLAYLVFKDLPLADYGNSLLAAQVKVELVMSAAFDQYKRWAIQTGQHENFDDGGSIPDIYGPYNPQANIANGTFSTNKDGIRYTYGMDGKRVDASADSTTLGTYCYLGTLGDKAVRYNPTGGINGIAYGDLTVAGVTLMSKGAAGTYPNLKGACVSAGGERLYVFFTDTGDIKKFNIYDADLNLLSSTINTTKEPAYLDGNLYYPWTQGQYSGGQFAVESDLEHLWTLETDNSLSIYTIAEDGTLSSVVHNFGTGATGTGGNTNYAICADKGFAFLDCNVGQTAVFDRSAIITTDTVSLSSIVQAECLRSNILESSDIDVSGLTQQVRGYKIAGGGTLRAAIEPLQAAWPFDAIPTGYTITFKPRGSASVATIAETDLDAHQGGEASGVSLTTSREMDSVLPQRVNLKYFDADREYDTGEQYAERLNTDSINTQALDLAIALNSTEAAGIVERLLYLYWLERHDVSFTLPPNYQALEPGDVVSLTANGVDYSLRLTSLNYLSDGRIECTAKHENAAVYQPTALGEASQSTGQTLSLPGASVVELLDIPLLLDTLDEPGFLVAMTGHMSGWPGGELLRTDDGGQTWADIQGFSTPGAVIGYALNTIGAGRTGLMDNASVLSVALIVGELSSVSELALLNGGNYFAYGQHGRWEIIGAKTCTLQGDGSYLVSDLLRGQQGTEWACGLHEVGDRLIELDSSALAFVSSNLNSIGLSRVYRGVTAGYSVDSAEDKEFTYSGVNLECLSPVYLFGNQSPSTYDWALSWIRRTRVGGAWRDYVDASLGEASEAYEVDIYNGSGYATVIRTIATTSATLTYTHAQQIADFGGAQPIIYGRAYQISAAVGRGYPLDFSLTNGSSGDPYAANVVLGMHMDDTGLTDIRGHAITKVGNATRSATQSKAGGYSAYFDGSGDSLTTPHSTDWQFGSGNFCVECWVYHVARPSSGYHQIAGTTGDSNLSGWRMLINPSGLPSFFRSSSGSETGIVSASITVPTGQWVHLAFTRYNNIGTLFVNGAIAQQAAMAVTITDSSGVLRIGATDASNWVLNGYIDDLRITKGVPRYTTDFSANLPVAPFLE